MDEQKMSKTKELPCILTWHDGNEIPNPSTGSFLILNSQGWLAEAEYNKKGIEKYFPDCTGGYWIQYRWSAPLKPEYVIAWCRFSDILKPEGN